MRSKRDRTPEEEVEIIDADSHEVASLSKKSARTNLSTPNNRVARRNARKPSDGSPSQKCSKTIAIMPSATEVEIKNVTERFKKTIDQMPKALAA